MQSEPVYFQPEFVEQLEQQLKSAKDIAHQALSYSSDMGVALRFLEQSMTCHQLNQLAENLHMALRSFALESVISMYSSSKASLWTVGNPSLGESVQLERAREKGRIVSEGAVTFFSYNHITLMVRNMPVDNEIRYGTLKDTLATMVNSANCRLTSLLHEQQLVERRDEVLKKIDEAMTNIAGRFDEMSGETEAAINNMIINIKYELVDWDIQRHQEESVLSVAKLCVEQATQINSSGLELDKQFDKITKAIRELTVKQNNEMFILPAPLQDMAGGLELF